MSRSAVILLLFLVMVVGCSQSSKEEETKKVEKKEAVEKAEDQAKPVQPDDVKPEKKPLVTPGKELFAVFETSMGVIEVKLYPDQTPKTVENFVGLATGEKRWINPKTLKKMENVPLYSGTIFHRVIPNFMIQGGDPKGTGTGGPGYVFEDEFVSSLKFDRPGLLAMANAGPNTNGSQFFITEVPAPHLDGRHTIFGEVMLGLDVVKKIARVPTGPRDKPKQDIALIKVRIEER